MAINQTRNNSELQRALLRQLEQAVDYVVQKIWNENREIIRHVVYESYQPEVYKRTDEFRNAWRTETNTSISGSKTTGHFSYDPSKLTPNADLGQHASLANGKPMQTYLAEIIYEGMAGAIYGKGYASDSRFAGQAWTEKRNAWVELEKWLGKENLKKLFEDGMDKAGLNYKRHNTAIQVRKD